MAKFFINRPIFASVISIIIVIAGLVASQVLPVAQYPQIAPPTVLITATYPGASAETLAKTVAAPIEEQLNGVESMVYFTSSASANGTVTITATFTLTENANGRAVVSDTVFETTSFDFSAQRFANIRAQRDAEDKLARSLATDIRMRLAMALTKG